MLRDLPYDQFARVISFLSDRTCAIPLFVVDEWTADFCYERRVLYVRSRTAKLEARCRFFRDNLAFLEARKALLERRHPLTRSRGSS